MDTIEQGSNASRSSSRATQIKNMMNNVLKIEQYNKKDQEVFVEKENKLNQFRKSMIKERMEINDQLVDEIHEKIKVSLVLLLEFVHCYGLFSNRL